VSNACRQKELDRCGGQSVNQRFAREQAHTHNSLALGCSTRYNLLEIIWNVGKPSQGITSEPVLVVLGATQNAGVAVYIAVDNFAKDCQVRVVPSFVLCMYLYLRWPRALHGKQVTTCIVDGGWGSGTGVPCMVSGDIIGRKERATAELRPSFYHDRGLGRPLAPSHSLSSQDVSKGFSHPTVGVRYRSQRFTSSRIRRLACRRLLTNL
jgi:hypothetical protein